LVIANAYQNSDLFWALRGGGGGTFGVVVCVTLQTFPEPPLVFQTFNVSFPSIPSLFNFTTSYLKHVPNITAMGGSGYYYMDPYGAIKGNGQPEFVVVHFFFNHTDVDAVNNLFAPVFQAASSINGTSTVNLTVPIPLARLALPTSGIDITGSNVVLGSRLYSIANLETPTGAANLSNALLNITYSLPPTVLQGHITAGGKVSANADLDTALNPSWRAAAGEIIIPVGWNDSTSPADQAALIQQLTFEEMPKLIAVDPTMGAYTNEANAYEPDWQTAFWGTNYPRLLAVKNKWDPLGLFRCNRCVGSERWDMSGTCPAIQYRWNVMT
jgi:Berberine and berberine like